MLSDEVLILLEEKGYTCPRLFEGGWKGGPGAWQFTVYDVKRCHHIHEQAATPLEAVAQMVVRVGGSSALAAGKEPDQMKSLMIAFNGLSLGYSMAAHYRGEKL